MTFRLRRSSRLLVASITATLVALTAACGGSTLPVSSSTGGSVAGGPAADYSSVIAASPVADSATVSGNAWASAVRDAGVLRVGGTDIVALWSLRDPATDKVQGFDAGLSAMLANYILGKPDTDLTLVTVDTRETLLENKSVDAVFATYTITPERAKKVAFAGPYYTSGTSILVKDSNTDIQSYKDLAGKNVVTQANSTGVTAIEQFAPAANLLTFPEDKQALAALVQGRADAYVIDEPILLADAVATPGLKLVGQPFTVDPYGIGLNKDSDAKAFVDAWLQKIYADGSWAALWKTTIGTVVSGDAPTPPVIGSVDGS